MYRCRSHISLVAVTLISTNYILIEENLKTRTYKDRVNNKYTINSVIFELFEDNKCKKLCNHSALLKSKCLMLEFLSFKSTLLRMSFEHDLCVYVIQSKSYKIF